MGGLGSFFGGGDSPEKTNVLASLLQSNDIGSLQSSYNDLITKAISGPSRSEPDNQALMFQVAIPTILAGLLGGKRGLAASAEPVSQAYLRELERSKEAQKQNQARDLTAAELVGKRINDVQDTFEKAAALEEKHQLGEERIKSDEKIAAENNETRKMMLAAQNQNAATAQAQTALMNEFRKADDTRADESAIGIEADRIGRVVRERIKPWREAYNATTTLQHLLANPNPANSQAIRGQAAIMNQGGMKQRLTEDDMRQFAPPNTASQVIAGASDWISGNWTRTLTAPEINLLKAVTSAKVDYLKQQYSDELSQFQKGLKSMSSTHIRLGRESELQDILISNGYPGMNEIQAIKPLSEQDRRLQQFRTLQSQLQSP